MGRQFERRDVAGDNVAGFVGAPIALKHERAEARVSERIEVAFDFAAFEFPEFSCLEVDGEFESRRFDFAANAVAADGPGTGFAREENLERRIESLKWRASVRNGCTPLPCPLLALAKRGRRTGG